jgi:hypothetical protein
MVPGLRENPEPLLFLQARDNQPVQPTFKQPVTLLSRKAAPKMLSRKDSSSGMAGLSLEDDDDSEEERREKAEASFAERQARAEKERAEKLRKYAEARERLFGSSAPSSGESRGASPNNKPSRGKGRGRGGRDNQPRSSNEQSPVRPAAGGRHLYDPSYSPKPEFLSDSIRSRPETPSGLEQPTRQPRGPQPGVRGFTFGGNHSGPSVD